MTTATQPARLSTLAVFRNRNFTLLWIAQLISVAGSTISWLAAALLIYRLTGSALNVSMIFVAATLPSLLVGLVAGVFVDRFDRKRLMIAADLIRAALACAIPVLLPFGIVWLYLLVLLIGAIGQFFDPAHASVLPEVASDEELATANSLMAISSQGVWALGFAAAGLIASQFALEWAFYLDGITFLVSAACIAGVRVGHIKTEEKTAVATVLRDLRAGVSFLARTPSLRSLFLVGVPIFAGLGLLNALLLPFSLRILHATELEYSLIEMLCSVGFIIGSLLMARVADRLHEGQWLALSFSAMGLGYMLFALSPTVLFAMAALMLYGMISAPAVIARQLVIQRNTPNAVRGRVNSAFFVTRDVLMATGMAMAGLADVVDVRVPFIVASLVLLAAGALVLVMPGLRQSVAEWRRSMQLLRGVKDLPALETGRPMTEADLAALTRHLPLLVGLGRAERQALLAQARIHDLQAEVAIMRLGDPSRDAFFLIDGRAIACIEAAGSYHTLEVLNAGALFGEIGALTGLPRTANVIATQASTVVQLPAAALRRLLEDPRMQRYFLSRMAERMLRMDLIDPPHHAIHRYHGPLELRPANPYATMLLSNQPEPDASELIGNAAIDDPNSTSLLFARGEI
jgi:DHA3 family macrolide efflux protein-like MFS transporter